MLHMEPGTSETSHLRWYFDVNAEARQTPRALAQTLSALSFLLSSLSSATMLVDRQQSDSVSFETYLHLDGLVYDGVPFLHCTFDLDYFSS